MHRSSSWEAKKPGSWENPSPQLLAPNGDANAASVELDGVASGWDQSFMA